MSVMSAARCLLLSPMTITWLATHSSSAFILSSMGTGAMFSPGQGCRRCRGWRGCRRWRCRGRYRGRCRGRCRR